MITRVPIEIINLHEEGLHLMVPALFGERQIGHLIVDTGASQSVLDIHNLQAYVEELTEMPDVQTLGVGEGEVECAVGQVGRFRIGELCMPNRLFVLIDLAHVNKVYGRFSKNTIWGLLGSDFLMEFRARIDYGKEELSLRFDKRKKKYRCP
jgi:hypothetical protein